MNATLTLDFGTRLTQDEQIDLLDEVRRRGCPVEEVLVEALRIRRASMPQTPPPVLAGGVQPQAAMAA